METIQQQIGVAAEAASVRSIWTRFIEWAHTGPARLVCDELACVDAVRAGLVDFVPDGDGRTTVIFRLEAPEGGPSADELKRRLIHDLVVFKDYVERNGHAGRGPTQVEEAALSSAVGHSGNKPRPSFPA